MSRWRTWGEIPTFMKNDFTLKYYRHLSRKRTSMVFKRIFDVIMSAVLLVLLSPVILVLAVWIKVDSKGPVFFRQERITQYGRKFRIFKFRTMVNDADKKGSLVTVGGDSRITRVGAVIRKYRLDEIPQLWNILRGDMSVIGPRPALWNQEDLLAERDKYGANDVTPGLTGWAQINGRDELEIPVKAKLDGEYVKKYGFTMDVRCFFGTFLSVLRQDGVVEGGTGSMKGK